MDATKPYLDFWPRIQKELADAGIATAWFNSMYSLTPHAAYPVQFREAVETLRYVLENPRRSPAQVLIAGDSAGGSLCLAILSHMLHRSDDVPELVLNGPLKGAILLSPWVSFSHDWPSVAHNKEKDIDAQEVTTRWSQLYLNGRASNNYIEAVDAPAEWWKGTQVEQVLVLAGADEVLIDSIKLWTSKFRVCPRLEPQFPRAIFNTRQKFNPNTTLVVGENECHVAPLIWPMFGDSHETEQERALKCWLLERLR
jgi:acetyl esterase/lipase